MLWAVDIIHSGEAMAVKETVATAVQGKCIRCGYMTSSDLCKACLLLEGLNKGMPKLAIGKKIHAVRQPSFAVTYLEERERERERKLELTGR